MVKICFFTYRRKEQEKFNCNFVESNYRKQIRQYKTSFFLVLLVVFHFFHTFLLKTRHIKQIRQEEISFFLWFYLFFINFCLYIIGEDNTYKVNTTI